MPYHHNQPQAFQDWSSGTGPLEDILLEGWPEATYRSSPRGVEFGQRSPAQQRFFQNAYQNVYSDYIGEMGRALRTGATPSTFDQYLETNPWTKRYSALPQAARGTTGMYASPRTRFLYNF